MPVGGHIELDENPEEGLFREIEEETGFTKEKLTILSNKPKFESTEQKYLYTPGLLDIHKINETHWHVGLIYFIKVMSSEIRLAEKEHKEIKWFALPELKKEKYKVRDDIIYAAEEAIKLARIHK